MSSERVVDLDDYDDQCRDDSIATLRLLVRMHNETHRRWRITPSAGGAYNYEKA